MSASEIPRRAGLSGKNLADIVEHYLDQRPSVRARVRGRSMWPTIHDNESVEFRRQTAPVAVGDLVLVRAKERVFLHRVVVRRSDELICRGDAFVVNDSPVRESDVVAVADCPRSFWRALLLVAWKFMIPFRRLAHGCVIRNGRSV